MPVGGDRGEARHGGHQERTGHCATGQGGDRRAPGVRGPARVTIASQETKITRTGPYNSQIIRMKCMRSSERFSACESLYYFYFFVFSLFFFFFRLVTPLRLYTHYGLDIILSEF